MNEIHQVLVYADDVNLIGDDMRTIERNADVELEIWLLRLEDCQ